MDKEAELNLIRECMRGEQRSFRLLVEAHQGLAYSIAYRFTKDEQEAEDIVQEAFLKIWKKIASYNEGFRFKTWLAQIVTNLCLDYMKSGRKKKEIHAARPTDPSTCQPDDLEAEELKVIVLRLAGQLTEKQKAAFILRDLQLLEPEEVCQILNMTAGNLKSNLYYARIKIKEGLRKYYKD